MLYFIAFLIEEEPKKYHRKLCRQIYERFYVEKIINSSIPPHLTLKAPFRTENIEEVEKVIQDFISNIKIKPKLRYGGFGSFRNDVVFAQIKFSDDLKELIKNFHKILSKKLKWIEFFENERKIHLHATLATGKNTKENFDSIMKYLEKEKPCYFDMIFNNIAILKYEDKAWKLHKIYRF